MNKQFDFENLPVVDIVNEIIEDAVTKKASDIHFDPTDKDLLVRIRIDGELVNYTHIPDNVRKNLVTRIKIISGMNITESRLPQDGAIKMQIKDKEVDMRVSSLPLAEGEKIVIRILDYSMSIDGLDSIGLSSENLEKVNKMIQVPNGIILVTGATGTGKSTTVYAILQKLNTSDRNLITVEDPIEMNIDGVNQVQVISDIGLTFTNVLRSILRQDPDIIMIGEIRDDETARIAVRASITGHLVLSTIHTNNSLNTIERLLDMEVERYLLGSALTGIISQRLARKLCPKCKTPRKTSSYEKEVFKKALNVNVDEIYSPVGCEECLDGYAGRIAIHEVLMMNQAIKDAITNNIQKDELRKIVYQKSGVTTLLQDGLKKVIDGITSFDEILRLIDIADDFLDLDNTTDLKQALLGKQIKSSSNNATEENEENENIDYEVLDF